ncbi:MAG: hypothetical protein K0S86_3733 [Geminicoccaceae bacterium]|jgi:hypothetical protein|nr:hypothetical protein [Geminicoccaceae bacterium]
MSETAAAVDSRRRGGGKASVRTRFSVLQARRVLALTAYGSVR